jgi:hypothetical protein
MAISMRTKKSTVHAYLDEIELKKLNILAEKWGISYSGVLRRLLRESKD